MTDGTLSYAIELSNRGFLGPLAAATGAMGRFVARAAAVAAPLAAATAGIGALAFAAKSVGKAAQFETLEVGVKNLLGTQEAAKSLLDQLQEFEASTPFTLVDQIAPLARQLLNAKVAAGDMLAEVTAIGNVAAGANVELGQLGAIYSKALNKGKVDGEIITQLAEAGVPIFSMLAQTLGVAEDQIMSLGSEGKISAGVLRQAFQDLANGQGAWANMMTEQSRTFTGLLSTLKGNIDQVMIAFGQPVMNALKPILEEAIDLVKGLKDEAAAIGQTLGRGISFAFEAIKQGTLDDIVLGAMKVGGMQLANAMVEGANGLIGKIPTVGDVLIGVLEGAAKLFEGALLSAAVGFGNLLAGEIGDALIKALSTVPFMEGVVKDLQLAQLGAKIQMGARARAAGSESQAAGRGLIDSALESARAAATKGQVFSSEKIAYAQEEQAQRIAMVNDALAMQGTKAEEATKAAQWSTDTQTKMAEATQKAKEAVTGLGAEAKATAEAEGRRRIKLFGLEESEARRAARRSAADVAPSALDTFFRGTRGNGNFLTDIGQSDLLTRALGASRLGGGALAAGSRAASGAVAATVNPNSTALGGSRRRAREEVDQSRSLVQLLQQIVTNTEPLQQLAVA